MQKAFLLIVVVLLVIWLGPSFTDSGGYRSGDLKYEGIKYNSGELDSCPVLQVTTAHFFGTTSGLEFNNNPYNKKTGCGHVFRPFTDTGVASWFYPCGTRLLITNLDKTSLVKGKSVIATVMDRGPDTKKYPSVKIDLYKGVFNELGGTGGQMQVSVVPVFGCAPEKIRSLLPSIKSVLSGIESILSRASISPSLGTRGEKHVLGEKCLSFLAISSQNPDLICSADCDMTWRSISNPGECYNE